jgi:mannose-1-phosphate guanylyltransferase
MVVREWEEGSALGRVEMDGRGVIRRILGRGGGESLTPVIFAGIHILSRRVFRYIPSAGFSCINRDCYGAMLEAGEVVCGFRAAGYWRDVGTPENYFGANMDFLAGVMPAHCRGLAGERRPSGVDVAPDVELIQPVVIGRHCRIGQGARIGPSVALGHGCTVGSGCNLERVVALPRSSFGDGEAAHSCIKSERATVAVCPAG